MFIGDLFAFAARAVIHAVQGANGPPQFSFDNLSGDQVAYGLWLDGLSSGGTPIQIQGSNFTCNNISVVQTGTPLTQGWAVYANVNDSCSLQIANAFVSWTMASAIEWLGNSNSLSITSLTAFVYNFGLSGAPAVHIGDNAGVGWNNVGMVGMARLINGHGGLAMAATGDGVACIGNCVYDNRPVNVHQ